MCRKYENYSISRDDLIQEGNLGLIKAVNRFDHRQGYRFSTYAGWWIRHTMQRSVANASRTVRVPVHFQDEYRRTVQAERELSAKLGREATNQEIAERCETTVDRIISIRSRAPGHAVSLDEPLGEDGTARMDLMIDPMNDQVSPLDLITTQHDIARVHELLHMLPSIQADVLRKRFGLGGDPPMTLKSIGDEYGLSRERVRQIQCIGLQALRSIIEKQG
jgi:RNA polymerase primary sigma factor